jgi:hypothetical protein
MKSINLLLLVLLAVVVILCCLVQAPAQNAPQCRELRGFDFSENRRFTFPAKVTGYDGMELTVSISISKEVKYTAFPVDAKSEFPVGFDKNYRDGLFTIVYCADTRTVLWVQKFVDLKEGYESKEKQDKRLAKKREEKKQ